MPSRADRGIAALIDRRVALSALARCVGAGALGAMVGSLGAAAGQGAGAAQGDAAGQRDAASKGDSASKGGGEADSPRTTKEPYQLCLGQWALHRAHGRGTLEPLDFPVYAKDAFGFMAVDYVNSFYRTLISTPGFPEELRYRCDDAGVRSVLILCDGEGEIAAPDAAARQKAVDNHRKWVDLARVLGCHSIRVNVHGAGDRDSQAKDAVAGLKLMAKVGADAGVRILAENHGGLSSDGGWLAAVMREVQLPNVGTMVDFKNFDIGEGNRYDYYKGIEELLPFAGGISAKSHDFDGEGEESGISYARVMSLVRSSPFNGFVEVEYEGSRLGEVDGIKATRDLLLRNGCRL